MIKAITGLMITITIAVASIAFAMEPVQIAIPETNLNISSTNVVMVDCTKNPSTYSYEFRGYLMLNGLGRASTNGASKHVTGKCVIPLIEVTMLEQCQFNGVPTNEYNSLTQQQMENAAWTLGPQKLMQVLYIVPSNEAPGQ